MNEENKESIIYSTNDDLVAIFTILLFCVWFSIVFIVYNMGLKKNLIARYTYDNT